MRFVFVYEVCVCVWGLCLCMRFVFVYEVCVCV